METKQFHKINIAIDGYSSCGKSTLAKALASYFGYIFIDSGAMYRGITLYAIENKLIENNSINTGQLISELPGITLHFGEHNGTEYPLFLNGRDVSDRIRSMEISQNVSQIAAVKEVRVKLVQQQQMMGKKGGVVMDGRDIGTVVFPDAEIKFFLTANLEIRSQRRFDELVSKGENVTLKSISENLKQRDFIDSTRTESPLIKATDAIEIDNSFLNEVEQLEIVKQQVEVVISEQLASS